jgi:SET domain-containing protein
MFATGDFLPEEHIAPGRFAGMRTPAGRYTNHSKNPNARFVLLDNNDVVLIASKEIYGCKGGENGEEITVDYRQALSLAKENLCQQ